MAASDPRGYARGGASATTTRRDERDRRHRRSGTQLVALRSFLRCRGPCRRARSVDSMPKSERSLKSTASARGASLFGAIHKVQQAVNFERATARIAGEERAPPSFTWREEETAAPLFGCIAGVGTCSAAARTARCCALRVHAPAHPHVGRAASDRQPARRQGPLHRRNERSPDELASGGVDESITLVTVVCLHSLRRATSPRGLLYMLSHPSAGKPELMSAKSRKFQNMAQITAQVSDPPAPRRRTILPLSDAGFVTPMVSARLARRVKRKAVFFFFLVLDAGSGSSSATTLRLAGGRWSRRWFRRHGACGEGRRRAWRLRRWRARQPFILSFLVLVASFVMWAWFVSLDIAGAVVDGLDEDSRIWSAHRAVQPGAAPRSAEQHGAVCAVQHQVGESAGDAALARIRRRRVSACSSPETNAVAAIVISVKTTSPKMRLLPRRLLLVRRPDLRPPAASSSSSTACARASRKGDWRRRSPR